MELLGIILILILIFAIGCYFVRQLDRALNAGEEASTILPVGESKVFPTIRNHKVS